MADPPPLIASLQDPSIYSHAVDSFEVIETHISWVILTGKFAYKIKKDVQYDFVDFSSLEKRQTYCERELELNRRLSPDLYLEVVQITGRETAPELNGGSSPIEYAVKMREFPQDNLLSKKAESNALAAGTIDELAVLVGEFHDSINADPPEDHFASPDLIRNNLTENFDAIDRDLLDTDTASTLDEIQYWSEERFRQLSSRFPVRRRNGSVKNCHGDMHLRNIVRYNDRLNIFDCIEFNDSFRWIDVMDEIAFLTMDLVERGHPEHAHRFVDRYLTHSNDYEGLPLLNFYRVYRAMVRCKVSHLKAEPASVTQLPDDFFRYLETAGAFTRTANPVLMLTHGVSGTGKTTVGQSILEAIGAIRLRSDVERKRLAGVPFTRDAGESYQEGLYSEDMTRRTYETLETKAETVLQAGFPVIVDASFLRATDRDQFRSLGERLEVPFRILNVTCGEEELRKRLQRRQEDETAVSDAGVDVLENQLELKDPLTSQERTRAITIRTDGDGLTGTALKEIKQLAGLEGQR